MSSRIATLICVGFLLGFVLACASIQGFFERWYPLQSSPTQIVELTAFASGKVFARDAEGTSVSCSIWGEGCWIQEPMVSERPPLAPDNDNFDTCTSSSILRFRMINPRRTVRDCLPYRIMYADGAELGAFILDDAAQVWHRSHITSPRGHLAFPLLGLLYGFGLCGAMAIILVIWRDLRYSR